MRILVFKGGALGDFLLTLPFLEAIRRTHPDVHLTLVGNPRAARLAVEAGILSECISQDDRRWAALHAGDPLPDELRQWLATFDEIISFLPDPEGDIHRALASLRGPTVRCLPPLPQEGSVAAHYCSHLAALGIHTSTTKSRSLWAHGPRQPVIAFHPGSGSPRKNWPVRLWNELLQKLPRPALLVASVQDSDALKGLEFPGQRLVDASLSDLADTLGKASFYIGHDTGVSHLAAAVGTPSLLLFGPTDPARWAPPGDHVHVLRAQPIESLSVEVVLAALNAQLSLTRGP